MIKKRRIIVTSVIITISLLISCLIAAFAYLHTRDLNKDSLEFDAQIYADGQAYDTGDSTAFPSSLIFSLASNSTTGVSLILNATVTPTDAPNKAVDWSVTWADGASRASETVTDYITVTPSSDGSTTATVTCYKAFTGDNIVITVTTRNGKFTASCVCSFVGKPSSISFNTGGFDSISDSDGIWKIKLNVGENYTFSTAFANEFGVVGSSYVPSLEITSITGVGQIVMKASRFNPELEGETITATLDSFVNVDSGTAQYLSCSISDSSNLSIQAKRLLENLSMQFTNEEMVTGVYEFDSFVGDIEPYVVIRVTDKNTNLSCVVAVRVASDVTGVSLSSTTLEY